jgi:hypothetical protein
MTHRSKRRRDKFDDHTHEKRRIFMRRIPPEFILENRRFRYLNDNAIIDFQY